MSRTKKGSKGTREFWSKRCPHAACSTGPYGKQVTHRYERRQGKEESFKAPRISADTEDLSIREEIRHDEYDREAFKRYLQEIGPADNDAD
jgi:hypothetical protein